MMKTIFDYTIHCTPEQTKKAIELGAQPEFIDSQEKVNKNKERVREKYGIHSCEYKNTDYYLVEIRYKNVPNIVVVNQVAYRLPTTEQMIGFLRDKNIHIVIHKDVVDNWSVYGHEITPVEFTVFDRLTGFDSYEEAILAAIDAALEYLSNNKK